MQIERKNNEIIITLDGAVNIDFLQKTMDYLRYLELGTKSKATQNQIEKVVEQVKQDWWKKNKDKFIK